MAFRSEKSEVASEPRKRIWLLMELRPQRVRDTHAHRDPRHRLLTLERRDLLPLQAQQQHVMKLTVTHSQGKSYTTTRLVVVIHHHSLTINHTLRPPL